MGCPREERAPRMHRIADLRREKESRHLYTLGVSLAYVGISCYRKHKQTKKRMYEQRCREVEHASFTPLVIPATGGLAKETTIF